MYTNYRAAKQTFNGKSLSFFDIHLAPP